MTTSQDLCVTPRLAVHVSCLRDLPGAKHHGSGQCAVELLLCYRKIFSPSQLQRTELCTLPAIKADHILVYATKSMASRSKEMILAFDSAFMRLQLEHCVRFGSPKQKKGIGIQEKAQWRTSRFSCRGPQHVTHEERLRQLGLLNLEKRRLKRNVIVLVEYQADIEEMDLENFDRCTLKGKKAMNAMLQK